MKLEPGKIYKDRQGNKWRVMDEEGSLDAPYDSLIWTVMLDDNSMSIHFKDGSYTRGEDEDKYDLIEEVKDETYNGVFRVVEDSDGIRLEKEPFITSNFKG